MLRPHTDLQEDQPFYTLVPEEEEVGVQGVVLNGIVDTLQCAEQLALHSQDAGILERLLGLVYHRLEQLFGLWVLGIQGQGTSKILIAELRLQG